MEFYIKTNIPLNKEGEDDFFLNPENYITSNPNLSEYFYDDGQLSYKTRYIKSLDSVAVEAYFPNGQLRYKGKYKNSNKLLAYLGRPFGKSKFEFTSDLDATSELLIKVGIWEYHTFDGNFKIIENHKVKMSRKLPGIPQERTYENLFYKDGKLLLKNQHRFFNLEEIQMIMEGEPFQRLKREFEKGLNTFGELLGKFYTLILFKLDDISHIKDDESFIMGDNWKNLFSKSFIKSLNNNISKYRPSIKGKGDHYFPEHLYYPDMRDGFKSLETLQFNKYLSDVPSKSSPPDYHDEFFKNGKLKSRYFYKNGGKDGHSKTFYSTGQLKASGPYKKNKKHGWFEYRYSNGQLSALAKYKNGKLDSSSFERYFSDGKIYQQGLFKNGMRQGLWKTYSREFCSHLSTGQLSISGHYKNNKMVGLWTKFGDKTDRNFIWDYQFDVSSLTESKELEPETIIEKGYFKNGVKDGYWEEAPESQIIRGHYNNGKRIGNWEIIRGNGNLKVNWNFDKHSRLPTPRELKKILDESLN